MARIDSVINDKYYGSFIGAIVGDALGWPQEDRGNQIGGLNTQPTHLFQQWKRKSGGRYQHYEDIIQAGSYSDDGQLLIATARSLRYGKNWSKYFNKVELPAWLIYERGGGGATKRAAGKLSNGILPWKLDQLKVEEVTSYFNAGGNGVTMRILPHVYNAHDNLNRITHDVFLNGISTHGHPRALLSAIIYAHAMHYLIHKSDSLKYGEVISYLIENINLWSEFPKLNKMDEWFEAAQFSTNNMYLDEWEKTSFELLNGLKIIQNALQMGMLDNTHDTLTKLNCFDRRIRGAGTVATLVSLYIASKYATNPIAGLVETAFMKNADTDTNASMVGGLLGSIYGSEWIRNEWCVVQDFGYLQRLINEIGTVTNEEAVVNLWSSRDNEKLKRELTQLSIGGALKFGPFGIIRLEEKLKNKVLTNSIDVFTFKLISYEGQSIYIKTVTKNFSNSLINKNKTLSPVKAQPSYQQNEGLFAEGHHYLSTKKLMEATMMLSNRVTAHKAVPILIKVYTEIQSKKQKQQVIDIKEVVDKFKSKTIDEDTLVKIVTYFCQTKD